MVNQLVAHLRGAITRGELGDTMPGIRSLAGTLGVSSNTVTAALEQLERENYLKPQGHGRRSLIFLPEGFARPAFRVNVANGKDDRRQSFTKAKFIEKGSIGPAPSI